MTFFRRLNNAESCIVCTRRSIGLAFGKPKKLGWYCDECSRDLVEGVLRMTAKELDYIEMRAVTALAKKAGDGPIVLEEKELPDFIAWVIREYGDVVRAEVETGKPPF